MKRLLLTYIMIGYCLFCCSQPKYRISDCGNGFTKVLVCKNNNKPQPYFIDNELYGYEKLILERKQDIEIEEIKTGTEILIERCLYEKWEAKSIDDYLNHVNNSFSSISMSHAGQFSNILTLQNIFNHKGEYVNKEPRLALIIANSRYQYNDSLSMASIEAIDVKNKLISLGFDCFVIKDLTYNQFEPVISAFRNYVINNQYKVSLLYYIGHGEEDNNGNDMLLPIDADTIGSKIIPVSLVIRKMQEGGEGKETRLLFFNACRKKNPYYNGSDRIVNTNLQDGTFVVKSTNKNNVADVTSNNNRWYSPFTVAFLDSLGTINENIGATYDRIVRKVKSVSPNQIPDRQGHNVNFSFYVPHFETIEDWRFYVGVGSSLLTQPAVVPCLNIGLSYKQWRFELGVAYNVKSDYSDDIFIYGSDKKLESGYKYKGDFRFFGNVGYDIPINKNLDFVPLLGVSLNRIRGEKLTDSSSNIGEYATAVSGTIDARVIWSPWKSRTIQFQGSFDFYGSPKFLKSENYKSFEDYDNSNTIKMWATGFDFQIGVIWNVTK